MPRNSLVKFWNKGEPKIKNNRIRWLLKLCKRRNLKVTTISCAIGQKVIPKEIIEVGNTHVVFIESCSGCPGIVNPVTGSREPTTECPMFEYGLLSHRKLTDKEIDFGQVTVGKPKQKQFWKTRIRREE